MERRCVIAFYYTKHNRYSVNVLVGALEKHGVPVALIRWNEPLVEEVRRLCRLYDYVVLCFSFMTMHVPYIMGLTRLIRRWRPRNLLLLAGGPHATGDPVGTVLKLGFDAACIGEGERTLPLLAEKLCEEGFEGLYDVPGLALPAGDGYSVVVTGKPEPIDLNDYPPYAPLHGLYNPIEVTRGCPFACRYCQVSYMHGARPRHRSVERIVEACREMLRKGLRDMRFITPNALGYGSPDTRPRPDRVVELLEALRELKRIGARVFYGSFPSELRPDFVEESVVHELRRLTDVREVIVGAQSGSDHVLKLMHRGHSVEDVLNAVDVLLKAGLRVSVDLIIGSPGEEKEDLEETIKLSYELAGKGCRLHLHTFLPLPGTPWEAMPPGRVPEWARKAFHKLIGMGKAYGDWERQEIDARIIEELRRKRIIYVGPEKALRMRWKK